MDDFNNFLSTQQILAGNSNPNPLQPDVWAYGVGTGAAVPAQFKGGVFILSPSGNPLDFSSADDGKSNTIFAAKPVTFGSINQTIRNFSLRGGYGGGGVATWKPDNNYWEAGPGVSAVLNVGVPVMVWFNIRGGLPNDFTGTVSSNVGIAVAVDQVAARGLAGLALISAAIPTPPTQGAAAGLGTAAGALTATGQGANLFVGGGYRVEMRFTGGNLNGIFYKGQKILDFDQFVRDAAQSTRDRYRPPVIPNRGIPAIADYNYTSQLVFGTSPWDLARTSGGLNQGNGAIAVANAWSSVIREYGFARLGQLPSDVAGIVLTGPNNMADAGKAVNAILSLVGQQEASQILNRLQNPYNLDFGVFGVKLANELFPGLRPGDYQFVRNAFEGRYRYILDNPRALLDDPVLVASAGKLYGILGIKKGDNPELDKVIELAEAKAQGQPLPDQIAAVLKDVSTYLGWIQSIVSKIDPAIGSGIGKAVTLANTGNLLLEAFSGNPNVSSGKLDDAALALFNAAAAFSPEIARIAPYVNTGKQALDVITGLSSGALTGPAAGASISSLAASLTGILGAPRELTLALEAAALAFRGVSLFAAGAVAGLVPVIGWAVSVVTFIIGLFAGNKEHWSNWQSILNQVSVDGGQNPITGQVLTNDTVDQKTSDKDRNRVRYNGQASEAPIQSVGYSIRPETTFVNAANGRYNIASMSSVDWDGADQGPVRDLRNANRITIVIDGQQHTLSSRGTDDSSGERLWNGSDGNDGWITISEGQLAPQTEVATGNYILDLNVTFASINPDVKAVGKSQSSTISADQAAQLRATFGVDAGTIGGADGRIASLKPFIAQMGEVRWETDHTTPNVYTYDDFNADGVPDLMRQGILDGLRVDNDGKFEVFINTAIGSPQFSYTAKSQEQAYAVGSRATVLMLYLASHPELYDLYLSQPQAHAAGNITPLYEWAQSNGVMAKLDQILALAGPPQGATLADQLQNMVDRGAQIASLKKELGISVDPAHLDTYPDLAAAFKHNTLQLLNHYIQYGNSEGRAVNESGQMLMRWQPRADGWGNAQSLAYIASYGDLMDAIGANADVGRAHWSNHGRWENRGITFSVDGYLASRPDVRAAAIAQLTLPGTVSSGGGEDSDSRAYVIVPTGDGGSARLYSRGTDENSGEAVWAGSDGNDGWISMT
ncbi:MAG: hypothetical protein SGJ17_13130, partial [Hyphomicrobiales bacterium]|nr:hypothetical protein [Hyphomicrobiales bacterium]